MVYKQISTSKTMKRTFDRRAFLAKLKEDSKKARRFETVYELDDNEELTEDEVEFEGGVPWKNQACKMSECLNNDLFVDVLKENQYRWDPAILNFSLRKSRGVNKWNPTFKEGKKNATFQSPPLMVQFYHMDEDGNYLKDQYAKEYKDAKWVMILRAGVPPGWEATNLEKEQFEFFDFVRSIGNGAVHCAIHDEDKKGNKAWEEVVDTEKDPDVMEKEMNEKIYLMKQLYTGGKVYDTMKVTRKIQTQFGRNNLHCWKVTEKSLLSNLDGMKKEVMKGSEIRSGDLVSINCSPYTWCMNPGNFGISIGFDKHVLVWKTPVVETKEKSELPVYDSENDY